MCVTIGAPCVHLYASGDGASSGAAPTPQGDDRYVFTDASATRHVVVTRTADGVSFAWPDDLASRDDGWDTALVGLTVHASGPAPHLTLTCGDITFDHYVDHAAGGLRWINLTGLRAVLTAGVHVSVQAHNLAIASGDATLQVFDNHLDLDGRILIISPHPDDAEIAAFGLYAGRNATIVTVTCGNAGDALYAEHIPDPVRQYRMKGVLRAIDSVTVPWQGGIRPEHAYNLGYFDARLPDMRAAPGDVIPELYGPNTDVAPYRAANLSTLLPNGSRANAWPHLVDDVAAILHRVNPDIVIMPFPQLDAHRDHEYATVAVYDAFAQWKGAARFLLYTNHATGSHDEYPYGPSAAATSVPPYAGDTFAVPSVYAPPVDADLMLRKFFALESMHDLRLSPFEQDAVAAGAANPSRRPDYPRQPAVDYLRRAPRPQEIFFVFDRAGVAATVEAFLRTETQR